jgi:hypothetical protein
VSQDNHDSKGWGYLSLPDDPDVETRQAIAEKAKEIEETFLNLGDGPTNVPVGFIGDWIIVFNPVARFGHVYHDSVVEQWLDHLRSTKPSVEER